MMHTMIPLGPEVYKAVSVWGISTSRLSVCLKAYEYRLNILCTTEQKTDRKVLGKAIYGLVIWRTLFFFGKKPQLSHHRNARTMFTEYMHVVTLFLYMKERPMKQNVFRFAQIVSIIIVVWFTACQMRASDIVFAVGVPRLDTEAEAALTDEERDDVSGLADLWQMLIATSLTDNPLFAVAEREDINQALRELVMNRALSIEDKQLRAGAFKGVDYLVLPFFSRKDDKNVLGYRLVAIRDNASLVGQEIVINAKTVETAASNAYEYIRRAALKHMATRENCIIVNILNFKNQTALPRSEWLETSIPRQIKQVLGYYDGVYLVESEDLDLLLQEKRLSAAHLTETSPDSTNTNPASTSRYISVSGSIIETQDKEKGLITRIAATILEKDSGQKNAFETSVAAERMSDQFTDICRSIAIFALAKKSNATDATATVQNKKTGTTVTDAEVDALLDEYFRLKHIGSQTDYKYENWRKLRSEKRWMNFEQLYIYFSKSMHSGSRSLTRKATILRAVDCLKRAIICRERDPFPKMLLACTLSDKQIANIPLATDLAREIASMYPDSPYQSGAWIYLLTKCNLTDSEMLYYGDQLLAHYPGRTTHYAIASELDTICRPLGDTHLTEDQWTSVRHHIEVLAGETSGDDHLPHVAAYTLFYLTQSKYIKGKGKVPRTESEQAAGVELFEGLLKRYPKRGLVLCGVWAEEYMKCQNQEKGIYWGRRGLSFIPPNLKSKGICDMRVYYPDRLRYHLAKALSERDEKKEALELLGAITHEYLQSDKTKLIKQLTADTSVDFTPPTCEQKEAAWLSGIPSLPDGLISDIASDDNDVWVAVKHAQASRFNNDHNIIMLESKADALKNALNVGGLARINRKTRALTWYSKADGLSDNWCTSVVSDGKTVYVGTYNEGVCLFDLATKAWTRVAEQEGLPMNQVQCLDLADGKLWVGMGRFRAGGVACIDLATHKVRAFLSTDYVNKTPPPTDYITDICVFANKVWCTTNNTGAAMYDPAANEWHTFRRYGKSIQAPNKELFQNHLQAVIPYQGKICFGAYGFSNVSLADRCIAQCDPDGTNWHMDTARDGVIEPGIEALAVYGDLFISGKYNGVLFRNADRKYVRYVTDGGSSKAARDIRISALTVVGDELWVGTDAGLKVLDLRHPGKSQ